MGPLEGVRVVEIAGIGPGPFCAMLLADMGAEVVRVERPASAEEFRWPPVLGRGRRSVVVDLRHERGAEVVLRLVESADALIEGFRPGVAERLGIGPDACLERNPRLLYGRMTGWGQEGPWRHAAGHDIDYIAVAGALHLVGRAGQAPVPPVNLLGDFGGGGLLLAFGIVCGLLEARRSGRGQVVDAAIVDGAALLTTMVRELAAMGLWRAERGANLLDGGAPFYDVYQTADGRYLAVGALEPRFYTELVTRLGLDASQLPAQADRDRWPQLRERLAAVFRTRTSAEWCELFDGSDACVAPVLAPDEAPDHPHNRARSTFVPVGGSLQAAPAPRFSRTPSAAPTTPPAPGQHTDEVLTSWSAFTPDEIATLRTSGAIA
ncbi:MAG TPA: CaiB/BaiF CoA-transferase family protein [Actinomycetes bacterium]|jgi:alpha-methylacyl-CoA racemase|nr:CaiB/BaiF CoA-transferase family protein [Actinomycetes bacterium]